MVDLIKMTLCDFVHLVAGLIWMVRKFQQLSDRGLGKAKFPAVADKGQTREVPLIVYPLITRRTSRFRQQPDLLVVTDRRNLAAGFTREASNGESLGTLPAHLTFPTFHRFRHQFFLLKL